MSAVPLSFFGGEPERRSCLQNRDFHRIQLRSHFLRHYLNKRSNPDHGGFCRDTVSQVAVPAVVGLTQAAAESAITGATLTVGAVTTDYSPTVPSGDVISQNPLGGVNVT